MVFPGMNGDGTRYFLRLYGFAQSHEIREDLAYAFNNMGDIKNH